LGLRRSSICHNWTGAMADNAFAEQIRKTAEALQDLYRIAREEEKKAAEELRKEKAKRKVECSTVCQRVLLPAMKLFAMGLESAKVFAPQCWKADYESSDDSYRCICWARLPKTETGVVVKSTMTMTVDEKDPPKIRVQVKCHTALPGDWKEIAALPLENPDDASDLFVGDLYGLDTAALDDWHKKKLEACAKACAIWLEEHLCVAV
jgi:hypothetical protein